MVCKYTFSSPQTAGGEGADVIFESVGHCTTLDSCLGWTGALGRRGTLVLLGYVSSNKNEQHDVRVHPMPMIVHEQTIVGSVGATLDDLKEAIEEFEDGLNSIRQGKCVGKFVCIL